MRRWLGHLIREQGGVLTLRRFGYRAYRRTEGIYICGRALPFSFNFFPIALTTHRPAQRSAEPWLRGHPLPRPSQLNVSGDSGKESVRKTCRLACAAEASD